jgi:hypothetical protein
MADWQAGTYGTIADNAPTPNPATNLPIVICASEYSVAVWMAQPMVKMPDQAKMEALRPNLSAVKA